MVLFWTVLTTEQTIVHVVTYTKKKKKNDADDALERMAIRLSTIGSNQQDQITQEIG